MNQITSEHYIKKTEKRNMKGNERNAVIIGKGVLYPSVWKIK